MSSDDIAIRVGNLSKCYPIYNTPRDRLKQFVAAAIATAGGDNAETIFPGILGAQRRLVRNQERRNRRHHRAQRLGQVHLLQIVCGTLFPSAAGWR